MMDWLDLPFFKDRTYKEVLSKLEGKSFLPKKERIFDAFGLCPFEKTRVLILGQDPYPTPGHANGLAFSVNKNVNPLPPSLYNIFTELYEDIAIYNFVHGDLTGWAKQGILLLNTSLTVEPGKPGSHAMIGWHTLIDQIFEALKTKDRMVFVLWGKHAKGYYPYISLSHHIIQSVHPSPLSATKGFFGSKPFSKINEYLEEPINWKL